MNRKDALKRQRETFGFTLAELVQKPGLPVLAPERDSARAQRFCTQYARLAQRYRFPFRRQSESEPSP